MKKLALALVIVILSLSATASISVPVKPAPTPTTISWRDCPYCHTPCAGEAKDGKFYFTNHFFLRIPISPTTSFETCQDVYAKVIGLAVRVMQEHGGGRIVENDK